MNIWAIGAKGGPARMYMQTANPAEILPQLKDGEELAPVTQTQMEVGVKLLGNMQVGPLDPPAPEAPGGEA